MNERIREDFSTPLADGQGNEWLLDARFDFIRTFPWLNHAIINIVTETGINRLHTTQEQGLLVAEKALIPCVSLDWITKSEHETYITTQTDRLEDLWDL